LLATCCCDSLRTVSHNVTSQCLRQRSPSNFKRDRAARLPGNLDHFYPSSRSSSSLPPQKDPLIKRSEPSHRPPAPPFNKQCYFKYHPHHPRRLSCPPNDPQRLLLHLLISCSVSHFSESVVPRCHQIMWSSLLRLKISEGSRRWLRRVRLWPRYLLLQVRKLDLLRPSLTSFSDSAGRKHDQRTGCTSGYRNCTAY
jgi:hypothetical protein